MADPYDELPYGDTAYFHTHPAHLGGLAVLCGLAPPALAGGRILEVGCGTGFNLVAMSRSLPDAEFVGLDASAVQVERARALAAAVGATNVRFLAGRVEELDDAEGDYDAIIAHGFYSWVPPAAQTALLELIRRRLEPDGLAYVSFNTKPGWNARGIVRDFLLGAVPAGGSPLDRARAARERLAAFVASLPDPESPYGRQVATLAKSLADEPDYYLLHEYFAEFNEALTFGEFAARLAAHGLQYVAEARFATSAFAQLGEDRKALDAVGDDLVRREQYHDYRWQRSLRQSIVRRADRAVPRVADVEAVGRLWIRPRVELVEPIGDVDATEFDEALREEDGEPIRIHDPFYRRFLRRLRAAPHLRLQPGAFAADVLDVTKFDLGFEKTRHLVMQVVLKGTIEEVWHVASEPTRYAATAGERPCACAFVRRQARSGGAIVDRWHRVVRLDAADRAKLVRLDGSVDRATLAAEFGIDGDDLDRFASAALLEG
jgi:SAM-dependent methyltransferase